VHVHELLRCIQKEVGVCADDHKSVLGLTSSNMFSASFLFIVGSMDLKLSVKVEGLNENTTTHS
jgi:hypothetical protein